MQFFTNWRQERAIRRTLRQVARQRVVKILQPGHVLVIEYAPPQSAATMERLRTCHLRGWLEVVQEGIPMAQVTTAGVPDAAEQGTLYRLTEAGWNVIHGTQTLLVATFWVSFGAFVAAVVAVYLQLVW